MAARPQGRDFALSVDSDAVLDRDGQIRVRLHREDIRESPPLQEHAPVSHDVEARLAAYYGWPTYWAGPDFWGSSAMVPVLEAPTGPRQAPAEAPTDQEIDATASPNRLRSAREVAGYHIEATDGELGHVKDFVFDLQSWLIQFIALDTRNWLPGRTVSIPPEWMTEIDALGRTAHVQRSRETLKNSPSIDLDGPIEDATADSLRAMQHA